MLDVNLFVFSYALQLLGSLLLLRQIAFVVKSAYGLSCDTQICLFLSLISRCVWQWDTRLAKTYTSNAELFASVVVSVMLIYYCCFRYRHTVVGADDYLSGCGSVAKTRLSIALRPYVLVPISFIAAVFWHPGPQRSWFTLQVLVSFTIYLEAVALLPQLLLMAVSVTEVEPVTNVYIVLLALSRGVRMAFWAVLFKQGDKFNGLFIADCLHTMGAVAYIYLWVSRFSFGQKFCKLPGNTPPPRAIFPMISSMTNRGSNSKKQ
jgi:hypothetical protein